jgi:hypothetical protein
MLFRIYSRYVPNLTRRDGSAMERLLKQHISVVPVTGLALQLDEKRPTGADKLIQLSLPNQTGTTEEPQSEADISGQACNTVSSPSPSG